MNGEINEQSKMLKHKRRENTWTTSLESIADVVVGKGMRGGD
jgi:predicted transcriptional regulator